MSKPTLFGGCSASSPGSRRARMLLKSLIYIGVKGAHPLGCLPLWGREGVTLANQKNFWRRIGFFLQQQSEINSGYHPGKMKDY